MAVFYCFFALIVILMNFTSIPAAIGNIFAGALTGEGVAGGALGALISAFNAPFSQTKQVSDQHRLRTPLFAPTSR